MMMGIYSLDSTDSLYVSHYVLAEAVKKWDLHNDDHVRVYDNYRKSDSMYHTGINYNYDLTKNFSDIDYSAFPKVSIEWDSIFNQSDSGIVYPVRRIDFLQKRKEDTPDSFWVRYRIYVYSSDYNHERYVPPSTSRALGFAISHEYHGLEFESFELWSWYSERIDCPHALKQISDSASYTLKSDTAHILISDFEIIDGDSVNVYLDNILVKENIALQKDPMIITISMQGKKTRELLFEALSEGTKSPCTIGVLIQETGQKFKLNSKKHHFMKVTLSR